MRVLSRLYFATSNDSKFEEGKLVLREFGLSIRRLRSKGVELQSDDVASVAAGAASDLSARIRSSFFVEDTGLYVRSLGGFPGAYAAFVYITVGLGGFLRLLSGSSDRTAEFVSAIALVKGSHKPRVFVGRLRGEIAKEPRGSNGFGFDPVFIPEGSSRTLGEMSLSEKCAISHRARALRAMGGWLVSPKPKESL
jgi:XTP/dITP diphosphohydrolase